MTILNQKGLKVGTTEDSTDIYIGCRWNEDKGAIEPTHQDKDMLLLRFVHDNTNTAYMSLQHANATSGTPVFTELIRFQADGDIVLLRGKVKVT